MPVSSRPLFAPHDVCLLAATAAPEAPPPPRLMAVATLAGRGGLAAKLLVVPEGQTAASLRTLPYVGDAPGPVRVHVRRLHGPVTVAPVLFRGGFEAIAPLWTQLAQPGDSELLIEAVKHEARVYVATTWAQLLPTAVAATYHGARLVFAPDAGELARFPGGDGAPVLAQTLHRQLLPHAVGRVLVPDPEQLGAYQGLFAVAQAADGPWEASAVAAILGEEVARAGARRRHLDEHADLVPTLPPPRAGAPLLSVAIPTFQRARLLQHTVSSVCAQAERYGLTDHLELVISDNASADDTAATVAQLARDTRIPVRSHRQPENLGVGYNVVQALALSQGTFCCLLGDDDFFVEGLLPRVLAALVTDPGVSLVVFRGHRPYPYEVPTRLDLEAVTRGLFYHIGNLGLAMVRTAHCAPALATADWRTRQRFWPQTELYFHAMLASGDPHPALAVPLEGVFHPLHSALTHYNGRYLWDEGFFSLVDVALRLRPHLPAWFIPTVLEHFVMPRFREVAGSLLNRYAEQDRPEEKAQALATMADSLSLCAAAGAQLGAWGGRLMADVAIAMLGYARPSTPADAAALVARIHEALAPARGVSA